MARISPRRQGDLGELSAIEWLGSRGYRVWVPVGHSPDCDLIADDGEELLRVQVKTTRRYRNRRWELMTCTKGGNRSWHGTVRLFSASRCDRLFVLAADGRRWFIPAAVISGGTCLLLGGPKYSTFEIDPGRPLPSGEPPIAKLDPSRRGSRAVKGT